jgi:hypothetical protein
MRMKMRRTLLRYEVTADALSKGAMRAWVPVLNRYPWNYFATMTFRFAASTYSAKKCFADFIKREATDAIYFTAVERSRFGERMHLHILLGGVQASEMLTLMKKWFRRYGYSRVYKYDKTKCAVYYVTKFITSPVADYDFLLPSLD